MASKVRPTAFVVSAVIAVSLASCGGEGSSSGTTTTLPTTTVAEAGTTTAAIETTEAPTTTSTTIDPAQWLADRVAKIDAMVTDFNSGDFDAWRGHFIAEGPNIFAKTVYDDDSDLEWERSLMAANEVWTVTGQCTQVGTVNVSCPFSKKNEFHGPAGIDITVPGLIFTFDEDLQISRVWTSYWEVAQDPDVFNAAFDAWLAEAHPDVYASFGPRAQGSSDGLPNPDDMPTALEYVAEFIQQSDEYPIG